MTPDGGTSVSFLASQAHPVIAYTTPSSAPATTTDDLVDRESSIRSALVWLDLQPVVEPRQPDDRANVGDQHLGLLRAIVIVWIGGAVTSTLVDSLLYRPLMTSILAGSQGHHPHHIRLTLVVFYFVTHGLFAAVAVTVGVRLVGFRVNYLTAAFALTLGATISLAITYATMSAFSGDPTQIAAPAFGAASWPLQLALGLVPAYLIDVNASPESPRTPPPYYGEPLGENRPRPDRPYW